MRTDIIICPKIIQKSTLLRKRFTWDLILGTRTQACHFKFLCFRSLYSGDYAFLSVPHPKPTSLGFPAIESFPTNFENKVIWNPMRSKRDVLYIFMICFEGIGGGWYWVMLRCSCSPGWPKCKFLHVGGERKREDKSDNACTFSLANSTFDKVWWDFIKFIL